jgi:hypothetical protein
VLILAGFQFPLSGLQWPRHELFHHAIFHEFSPVATWNVESEILAAIQRHLGATPAIAGNKRDLHIQPIGNKENLKNSV